MRYAEFLKKEAFTKEELLAITRGNLVEDPPPGGTGVLPSPPFLMFDRVPLLKRSGATGQVVAEQDIRPDAWYFQCHFPCDPVQPGCLGVDALWQLLGLFCSANGAVGNGRALGCEAVEFMGQIRPYDRVVRYDLNVRRLSKLKTSGTAIAIADGRVFVDDEQIYTVRGAKVGVFRGIAYEDYPNPDSQYARGGLMHHGSA